jgi:hypothetical protein
MILNALGLDPNRIWKGSWRWFSEEMLLDRTRSAPDDMLRAAFGPSAISGTASNGEVRPAASAQPASASSTPQPTKPTTAASPLAKIESEGLSFEEFLFLAVIKSKRLWEWSGSD